MTSTAAAGAATHERARHAATHPRALASIAAKLDALASPTTHVLHSIPVGMGSGVIDHLIVGPQGVFAVDTRHHSGHRVVVDGYALHVDGEYLPWLRTAKFQAERAASLLRAQSRIEVPVRACVVLLTGLTSPAVTFHTRPIGASVLTKRDVPRFFHRQPAVLTQAEVTDIVWAARAVGQAAA